MGEGLALFPAKEGVSMGTKLGKAYTDQSKNCLPNIVSTRVHQTP